MLEAEEREGRRSRPQIETPAGKASKIIGSFANGYLTKAMAKLTSFGVAPMTDATVNTITGMLRHSDDRRPSGKWDRMNPHATRSDAPPQNDGPRAKQRTSRVWAPEHLCVALGHPDLGKELTNFLIHFIQGDLGEGTQRALMLQTVTPLDKGTNGKLRLLGCAATFRRVAYGALVRAEAANLAKVFGPARHAVTGIALERHSGGDQNKMQCSRGSIRL